MNQYVSSGGGAVVGGDGRGARGAGWGATRSYRGPGEGTTPALLVFFAVYIFADRTAGNNLNK